MSRTVDVSSQADADLDAHFLYISQDSPDAAYRFLQSAEATFNRLAEFPLSAPRVTLNNPRLADIRTTPVKDFSNFLIFYQPLPDGIRVARVLHGARDLEALFQTQP